MITRRKILSWLGLASAALGATVRTGEARIDPRPHRADGGPSPLREFRLAWRYDFQGDHKYAAIRRCIGLRKLYKQGRITREEFQALLPHNLRHELGHLPDLPWPDADDEAWNDHVVSGISPWGELPEWPNEEIAAARARGRAMLKSG
jgi:hypothetical protein